MHEFVERNRGFFSRLSSLLRGTSSVLLVLGIIWAALKSVGLFSRIGDWQALREYWVDVPSGIFLFILLGLVARGMSQLFRYMHDVDYRPEWLLRHGDWLLYAYAVLFTVRGLIDLSGALGSEQAHSHPGWMALGGVITLLYVVAGDLVFVGLAQLLRRLMPVIDEVRTLA